MIHSSNLLWLQVLAESACRSLLMAACVGLALAALRIRNAAALRFAWSLVLGGAILMPFASSWAKAHVDTLPALLRLKVGNATALLQRARPQANTLTQPLTPAPARDFHSDEQVPAAPDPAQSHVNFSPQIISAQPAPRVHIPPAGIVLLFYGAITLLLLARILVGLVSALRIWAEAIPLRCDGFEQVRVRISPQIASPVTLGSGVLLPSLSRAWDDRKLRIVLAHEASHARRGDFYMQFCAEAYTAIFWFSPLGWWLRRKLCALNETLSDGAAVREAASHANYAQILLEFAVLPRTTIGVAMARPASVSARIERLLDESRFRQAFVASPVHKLVACTAAPVLICASAALFQVSALAATQQSTPEQSTPTIASPVAAVVPEAAQASPSMPVPPPATEAPAIAPAVRSTPAPQVIQQPAAPTDPGQTPVPPANPPAKENYGSYTHERDGEFYGLFERHGGNPHFSGTWANGHSDVIEKAQKLANGDFLLYTDRNGKSYYIDDPEVVLPIEVQYRVMRDFWSSGQGFEKAQEALKRVQAKFAEQKSRPIDKAELQKQLAELSTTLAKMQNGKPDTLSPAQLRELQGKLGALQGDLARLQVSASFTEANLKLGEKMAALAKQRGEFGMREGEMSRDAELKMKSAIEQALKSGKAKPVE